MSSPSKLPLFGFASPHGRLPSFLVPIFGTGPDFWMQDSVGGGLLSRFYPCGLSTEQIHSNPNELFQEIGMELLYAFQFPNEPVQVGNKETIQMYLIQIFDRLKPFKFITVEVVNFIENVQAYPETIREAKAKLANNQPDAAEKWGETLKSPARALFEEGASLIMSSTILGTVNYFIKRGVELDLQVVPDSEGAILKKGEGTVSILTTRFKQRGSEMDCDRVSARIFIHKDANRHLARICIAREIYHLLLELDSYLQSNRKQWSLISANKKAEDECNQFAWELCKRHDEFARNYPAQQRYMRFPEGVFDRVSKPISTDIPWPRGIAIDPQNPFYVLPAVHLDQD